MFSEFACAQTLHILTHYRCSSHRPVSSRASQETWSHDLICFENKKRTLSFSKSLWIWKNEEKIPLQIRSKLKNTIQNRGFVIMKVESIQSIINPILIRQNQIPTFENEKVQPHMKCYVQCIQNIPSSLKNGAVIVDDEIDQTFDPFRDLCYPYPEHSYPDPNIRAVINESIFAIAERKPTRKSFRSL